MNILRLSTVALTLVLFTMGALFLPVNTALAHCKGSHEQLKDCKLPHGTGGGGGDETDPVLYSATWDGDVDGTSDGKHPAKVSDWTGTKKAVGLNIGGDT